MSVKGKGQRAKGASVDAAETCDAISFLHFFGVEIHAAHVEIDLHVGKWLQINNNAGTKSHGSADLSTS
jgi:hypothetical protein